MLRPELVEDARALGALAPAWWDLWRCLPGATPFRSPAWLLPWWQTFAPGRLATVALWAGDRLAALAPAYVEAGPLGRRLLPLGIGISDDLDILIDPGLPEAPANLANALGEIAGVESWEFEELRPGACAWSLPRPDGLAESVSEQSACPVLALSGEGGLAAVPPRQRRKLRMAQHRTARRGGQIERLGSGDLGPFLEHLSRLHGARWRSRGEGGVLEPETVQLFHRRTLPQLVVDEMADLLILTIEGRVVGAHYGLCRPGHALAYLGGFDPDYAFESPGTVLLGRAIADAAARGARELDLLRGQEAYKYAWGAVDRWNGRRSWRRAATA